MKVLLVSEGTWEGVKGRCAKAGWVDSVPLSDRLRGLGRDVVMKAAYETGASEHLLQHLANMPTAMGMEGMSPTVEEIRGDRGVPFTDPAELVDEADLVIVLPPDSRVAMSAIVGFFSGDMVERILGDLSLTPLS